MKRKIIPMLCVFALLGACSGGGDGNTETAADNDTVDSNDGADNDGSGDEDSASVCTPAPRGTTIVSQVASTLTDGCIDDEQPVGMFLANKSDFNFQLDTSGYTLGGKQAKGIFVYSNGGGVSLINPYWLLGETEYTYSGLLMPVAHRDGGFYIHIGGDFDLAEFNELNLDIRGTVGDPQIGSITTVEINWAMVDEDVSGSAKVSRRGYGVAGMPNGTLFATSDNPLRHLTWLLAQDVDERLLAMYDRIDNCTPPGLFTPRMRAQFIDATGELGQAYIQSAQDVRYSGDVSTTHQVFTVDWDYMDDTYLSRLMSEATIQLASDNGCQTTLAAPVKYDYSALRQQLLSGSLSAQPNEWSY